MRLQPAGTVADVGPAVGSPDRVQRWRPPRRVLAEQLLAGNVRGAGGGRRARRPRARAWALRTPCALRHAALAESRVHQPGQLGEQLAYRRHDTDQVEVDIALS